MILTAAQVRQACVLLRWKAPRLCRHAKVSYKAALNARRDEGILVVPGSDLWAIREAFEAAGVEFTAEPPGVRLRATPSTRPDET